jgi:hypothetical protein
VDSIGKEWAETLLHNGLDCFEKLWALETEWFEEPNKRRGGWSGVARIQLALPDGGEVGAFLKRQENHNCRTLHHPFKGEPTFKREFVWIHRFEALDIPSLETIFYGDRMVDGKHQAILMTLELTGFLPLSSENICLDSIASKNRLFERVAALLQRMHSENLQHNCFYPNHIFAKKMAGGGFEVRVIDLEKVKRTLFKRSAVIRDLSTISGHSPNSSLTDRMRFFKLYRNEQSLSPESKVLWRSIAQKSSKRR